MLKRNIYFLVFLLGSTFFAKGQTVELQGHVRDSIGNGIPLINVFVQKKGQTKILDYAYSDDKGYYSLHVKDTGSFTLNFSGLSFKKEQIPFNIDSLFSSTIITKDIILKEESFKLDEVIINSDRAIIVKKDTISIKISEFINGNEEVVEDVLKKLPGIEVSSDGNIKVQGKSIEKVMIEGDDLFEKGYKLLTKNLNADVINRVEILEHFSDNPILKGIEDSDKIALNITLKEDRKSSLFGNASLGYGTRQYYENKLNLISFNPKTKYYFFGNLNNTGADPTGDIYQLIYPDVFSGTNYIGDDISSYSFISIGSDFLNLNKRRTNFNNAELASLNGIFNPTEKVKLKGLFFVNSDETDFFRNNTQQYFLTDDSFTNTEQYELRKKTLSLFGKWDAIYKISKDKRIEYIGKYSNYNEDQSSNTLFNNEQLVDNLENKYWFTNHRVTYTQRLKNKSAIQITGRYIHDTKPQDYFVNTFLYQDLFPQAEDITSVRQEVDSQVDFLGVEGTYYNSKNGNPLDIRIGYVYQNERLNSDLFFINSQGLSFNQGDLYRNQLENSINDIYGKFKYKHTFNKVALKTSLEAHQRYNSLTNKEEKTKDSQLFLNPSLGFSWKINKKNNFNVLYRYSTKNIFANNLYNGFVLNDYRSFKKGLGSIEQLNGNIFLSNYTFGNWSSAFLINASFLYQQDNDYLSSTRIIETNFDQQTTILLKNREFYSSNISVDRFIKKLSTNLKLDFSFSSTKNQNIVNNSDLRDIRSNTYNYGVEFRSAFDSGFNFHIGTKWITSIVKSINTNTNTDNSSFLDLNFDLSEKINIELKNENYYFGSLSENNNYFFTDIHTKWKLNKKSMNMKFVINNLFNTNNFANYYISDLSISSSNYRLIPRYFLLKFDFRF